MMVGFLLPLAARAQAETEVSLNFFYDNLSDQGNWIEVADYGYCFQPNVAVSSADWRPYADGYWAYTDAGWTWVSYEDFGWATYHYGRWTNLADYGWVWVPGYEWGPAWVSWRTGGDYVGWAPLPPQGGDVVYEGRAITGAVDVTFGIGPLYYNFVDIRYIGEPVLRERLIEPSRNVTIINNTVNVTNITYNNSMVINNGPDLNRVNQFSTRPIQRLTLQREPTVPANLGQGGKRGNFNRVNGNQFMVVAPQIQKSQQPVAPKLVKAKVAKPKIEHGWQGVANRQQIEAQMKKENPKNILPPNFQAQKGRKAQAAAAGPNASAQPNENARAQSVPAAANDQQAGRPSPKAQQNGRGQNAAQPDQNVNAEQAAAQERQKNAREQRGQQAEQQKADRAPQAQERIPRQDEQRQQPVRVRPQPADRASQDQPARRAQAPDAQQPDRAQKAQEEQPRQRPERARPMEQPNRPDRAQPVERPNRPERAQRPPPNRQPPEARPEQPQGNQEPNAEHKGKKKKPSDEQPPQP